jgi:hypothetical protein
VKIWLPAPTSSRTPRKLSRTFWLAWINSSSMPVKCSCAEASLLIWSAVRPAAPPVDSISAAVVAATLALSENSCSPAAAAPPAAAPTRNAPDANEIARKIPDEAAAAATEPRVSRPRLVSAF